MKTKLDPRHELVSMSYDDVESTFNKISGEENALHNLITLRVLRELVKRYGTNSSKFFTSLGEIGAVEKVKSLLRFNYFGEISFFIGYFTDPESTVGGTWYVVNLTNVEDIIAKDHDIYAEVIKAGFGTAFLTFRESNTEPNSDKTKALYISLERDPPRYIGRIKPTLNYESVPKLSNVATMISNFNWVDDALVRTLISSTVNFIIKYLAS